MVVGKKHLTIKDILDEIIEAGEPKQMSGLEKAMHGFSWLNLEAGRNLLALLEKSPEYDIFNQQLQSLGKTAWSTEVKDLADWLVERASRVGSDQAINELNTYIESPKVNVFEVMLLASVYIDDEYQFCNGVKIIKPHQIPNEYLATNIVHNTYNSVLPFPQVQSVLIARYSQEVKHWSNTDSSGKTPLADIPINELEEARLCLALVRSIGRGIHSIGHGTIAPDNLPFKQSVSGWSVSSLKQPRLSPSINIIKMQAADHLLEKLRKLPLSLKNKLMIPIEKLNHYGSGDKGVDTAIDLRICLESIFLSDGNKVQLRYTLSLRAALFLGDTLEKKKEIKKLIRDAYDVTSSAVHTGKLPTNNTDLLPKAAEIARQSIIKLINNGAVDWTEIELQAI